MLCLCPNSESFDAATAPNFPEELKQKEYLLPISEDLLELIIHVVSEVYECKVSEIDALKKVEREIVQQLCIAPMAHSDIIKNVYTDTETLVSEQEINSILARVAVFKPPRPSSNEKGVYTLREQFHAQYSPYFYHYVKAEKTKSEEAQLALKTRDSDKFFKPSPLPRLRSTFAAIEHLLDADLFIKICVTVLRRSLDKTCWYFSEGQLAKVLHLIGLALHKEKIDIDDNAKNTIKMYTFKFLEKTVQKSSKPNLLELLAECSSQLVTNQYKLLSMWILDYTQALKDKKFVSESSLSEAAASPDETASTSSRRSNSPTEDGGVQKEKRKNLVAEKRRAKILAQLNKQQKNFIQNNKVSWHSLTHLVPSLFFLTVLIPICLPPLDLTLRPSSTRPKALRCRPAASKQPQLPLWRRSSATRIKWFASDLTRQCLIWMRYRKSPTNAYCVRKRKRSPFSANPSPW
jgi:E3 ubiquitin-protein ligase UBR2